MVVDYSVDGVGQTNIYGELVCKCGSTEFVVLHPEEYIWRVRCVRCGRKGTVASS